MMNIGPTGTPRTSSLTINYLTNHDEIVNIFNIAHSIKPTSGGSRGCQSGNGPPSKLAIEFGPPLEEEKNNDSVNVPKFKVLPPLSMLALGFCPLWRSATLEGLKRLMTRKGNQEIFGDR